MTAGFFWQAGTAFGATGVILGAFGSHGLKSAIAAWPDAAKRIDNWSIATKYQFIHSLLLLAISLKLSSNDAAAPPRSASHPPSTSVAGWLAIAGIVGFSGSIYLLSLDKNKSYSKLLGPITPLGGLCMIASWIVTALL
ncbi:hypothetical protein BC831DRAFT_515675 [Entophlyctis helioformis]|nr:hypothetical protein BC831DRAFT_515675 [Entophlyctis helioformis]